MIKDQLLINEWLNKYSDLKIDTIITDPPYPFDSQNGTHRFDDMYPLLSWSDLQDICTKFYSMMNDGGRIYLFCNRDGLFPTRDLLEKSGFKVLNLLVWNKKHFGGGYHYRNQVEYIYYACRGKPKVYIKNISNIFEYSRPTKKDDIAEVGYFPSEQLSSKPLNIYKDILKNGTIAEELIADPFAGSDPLRAAVLTDEELKQRNYKVYTNAWSMNES